MPQVALSFDEKSGVYNHHCVNQEHLIGYDASQNHQKVAALLTLGELLVEGTIPVGTLRAGAFNNPPNQEQIKDAFESYPWFSWNSGVLTLVQKFKMDLKGDHSAALVTDGSLRPSVTRAALWRGRFSAKRGTSAGSTGGRRRGAILATFYGRLLTHFWLLLDSFSVESKKSSKNVGKKWRKTAYTLAFFLTQFLSFEV